MEYESHGPRRSRGFVSLLFLFGLCGLRRGCDCLGFWIERCLGTDEVEQGVVDKLAKAEITEDVRQTGHRSFEVHVGHQRIRPGRKKNKWD